MKRSRVRHRSPESLLPWLWLVWIATLLVLLWKIASSSAWAPVSSDSAFAEGEADLAVFHSAVGRFGAFVVEGGGGQVTRDRDYVAEGIERLAEALTDVVAHGRVDGARVEQRIDELVAMAAMLREEHLRKVQTRVARHAFVTAAGVMASLQASRYPHLDRVAAEARQAALDLRTDRALVAQGEEVQRFFERSHDVVRAMTW